MSVDLATQRSPGEVGPGDHVLMVSNGAGTGLTCAVVEIVASPAWI